jgi:3-deoxy-D-manno-octulosonic-acid transferase
MPQAFSASVSQRLALFIYLMFWLLLLPFAAVHFIFQWMRNKHGYDVNRLSRFGLESSENFKPNGVLIHCASVGEVVAIQTLVEQILKADPELFITITTNTTTGADRVKLLFAGRVSHAYLPYDFAPFSWLFLVRRRPSMLLINEMELWPILSTSVGGLTFRSILSMLE